LGSVDDTEADAEDIENYHRETFSYDVKSWDEGNCSGYDLDQPERSK
jgi:hypothetical protein